MFQIGLKKFSDYISKYFIYSYIYLGNIKFQNIYFQHWGLGIGDWGLGIGDWG